MSPSFNDPFGWGDDHGRSYHHNSSSRLHAPVAGSQSGSEVQWANRPYPENDMHPGLAPTPWGSTGPHVTAYGGNVLSSGQRVDQAHLGPSFSDTANNIPGLGMNHFMGMEVPASMLEQPFPVEHGAFHAPQPYPSSPSGWIAPEPSWQPSSVWDHAVRNAGYYGGQSSSNGFLDICPPNPLPQVAAPPLTAGYSGNRVFPAGYSTSMAPPPSVQTLAHANPVTIAAPTSQPRGGPSDHPLNMDTFQCLWTSGGTRCRSLIKCDRKWVTSHLRDVHAFTCDDRVIACAWSNCTVPPMQRRNIPRHIVACHFEVKFTCPWCKTTLSRRDAMRNHQPRCPGLRKLRVGGGREGDDGR